MKFITNRRNVLLAHLRTGHTFVRSADPSQEPKVYMKVSSEDGHIGVVDLTTGMYRPTSWIIGESLTEVIIAEAQISEIKQ